MEIQPNWSMPLLTQSKVPPWPTCFFRLWGTKNSMADAGCASKCGWRAGDTRWRILKIAMLAKKIY